MDWRRARWIASALLLVLGLFDLPEQLQKVRDALTVSAEWISQHGLDQNGWRWAFVIGAAAVAFGPEVFERVREVVGKRRKSYSSTASVVPADVLPPAWARPVTPSAPTRVFVGEGVTPQFLIDLYNSGATTLQKNANVANFIGKWMRVTGTVSDIGSNPPRLEFAEYKGAILTTLDMWFDDVWKDRLAILAPNSKLNVEGLGLATRTHRPDDQGPSSRVLGPRLQGLSRAGQRQQQN